MEARFGLRTDPFGGASLVAVDGLDRCSRPDCVLRSCLLQAGAHRVSRQPVHVLQISNDVRRRRYFGAPGALE